MVCSSGHPPAHSHSAQQVGIASLVIFRPVDRHLVHEGTSTLSAGRALVHAVMIWKCSGCFVELHPLLVSVFASQLFSVNCGCQ